MSSVDWERTKNLRVTRKFAEALKNLEQTSLHLTPSNRRKSDTRSKFLGHGDGQAMTAAEIDYVLKEPRPICAAIRSTKEGLAKCAGCWQNIVTDAVEQGKTVTSTCHAGLVETATPIKLGNQLLGVFRYGEYIRDTENSITAERVKENAQQLGVDTNKAHNTMEATPYFSEEKEGMIISVVEMMADEIGTYVREMHHDHEDYPDASDHNYGGIITQDPTILNIIKQLKMVAASDSSVIIYGESGTGKELIAKQIQSNSERVDKPFVTINCAALTETILEAELFGYKKGAFTGANSDKKGLFEVADGGTVFLDEVGEMSLSLQVKLLRLIQEGTFMRVGDTRNDSVDVRVVSATHQDLSKLIDLGRFREDLYYRLAVVELTLPPLRDRKGDVQLLANHFLKLFQEKIGKEGIKLSQEAMTIFDDYYWPGNIRELSNEIERIVAMVPPHSLVHQNELSRKFYYEQPIDTGRELELEDEGAIKEMVETFEKNLLVKYLNKYQWNKSKVARLCGITRQGLNKKISKYRLDRRKTTA